MRIADLLSNENRLPSPKPTPPPPGPDISDSHQQTISASQPDKLQAVAAAAIYNDSASSTTLGQAAAISMSRSTRALPALGLGARPKTWNIHKRRAEALEAEERIKKQRMSPPSSQSPEMEQQAPQSVTAAQDRRAPEGASGMAMPRTVPVNLKLPLPSLKTDFLLCPRTVPGSTSTSPLKPAPPQPSHIQWAASPFSSSIMGFRNTSSARGSEDSLATRDNNNYGGDDDGSLNEESRAPSREGSADFSSRTGGVRRQNNPAELRGQEVSAGKEEQIADAAEKVHSGMELQQGNNAADQLIASTQSEIDMEDQRASDVEISGPNMSEGETSEPAINETRAQRVPTSPKPLLTTTRPRAGSKVVTATATNTGTTAAKLLIKIGPHAAPIFCHTTFTPKKFTIQEIIDHQPHPTIDHAFELLVKWAGFGQPSWEPERSIQADAPAIVYAYWARQPDGRPSDGFYRVFTILKHWSLNKSSTIKKKRTRGRSATLTDKRKASEITQNDGQHPQRMKSKYLVQWEGYSADDNDTTVETEEKLRNIAPEELEVYWDHVLGKN